MQENEKKIIKLIKYWIAPNIIETLIVFVVYLILPKDPKNIWLFGYSKSRLFILGSILIYVVAILLLFFPLSNPPKKLSSTLQKLKSHPSTNYSIEIIDGACLIVLYFCGYYYFNVFQTNGTIEPIHLRFAPILAYFSVFIIQLFIFLVLFQLTLSNEKFTLEKIWHGSTLPIIRQKVFNKIDAFVTFTAEKFSKSFLSTVFVITPALLTTTFIWMFFTTSIFNHIPVGPDQIDYWHETLTFVHHGFTGGQYSFNEIPAPAEFTRFGPHGPAYPILYGLIGRVIGWEYYSGALINLLLITLALWIVILLGNLDKKQLVSGIALIGTFWPLLYYIPTNMIESPNQAIAIIFSILFFKQIKNQKNNWKIIIPIFIILLVSTMIRTTWSLLFFPFFLFMIFDYKGYKLWGAILISGIGVVFGMLFIRNFFSPYPAAVFGSFMNGLLTVQEAVDQIQLQIQQNVIRLIDESDTPFFIQAFRFQISGYVLFIVYKLTQHFRIKDWAIKKLVRSELGFHTINILIPFIIVIILSNVADTRDYRLLSASFLLSALFLLLFSRYKYVYAIVFMNALLVLSFIPGYIQQRSNNFIYNEYKIRIFKNTIAEYIEYDNTQSNRWCNTLAFQTKWDSALITVDTGIGLTEITSISDETKSKYLLLNKDLVANSKKYINSLGLIRLVKTDVGVLYLNPNSDCE